MTSWLSPSNLIVDLDKREVRNIHEVPLLGDGTKNTNCFVPEKLEEAWKSSGSNVAMTHGYSGRQLRYSELLQHVRQLANAFQAEGLRERTPKKGRFYRKLQDDSEAGSKFAYVLVLSNNSLEVYVTIFALWLAECTVILADTSWTFGRIVDILKGRFVNVVVADGASRSLASQLIASPLCTIKRALYTDDPLSIPAMMALNSNGVSGQQEGPERPSEGRSSSRLSQSPKSAAVCVLRSIINYHKGPSRCSDDPILIVFTSATSREPKPVEISHFRFLAAASTFVDVGLYGKTNHILVWNPPYELAGIMAVFTTLLCGSRVVLVPERTAPTDPKQIAYICRDHKVNSLIGSPDMLSSLLKDELREQFGDITSVLALPNGYIPRRDLSVLQRLSQFFKLEESQLRVAYGTVETTGPVIISLDVRGGPTRGLPLPHVRIRVICRPAIVGGSERLAGPGEEGEIVVSGRSIAQKYWSLSGSSQDREGRGQQDQNSFMGDGWFRTGDYGFYDERGQVTVLGALEDLVALPNLFGSSKQLRWVHSSIFEVFLLQQPGVHDVKVVSVPRGSALPPDIVACIVPDNDMDDGQLVDGLRTIIETAAYPLNRLQKVYIFDELPRSSWKRRPSRRLILAQILQTTTL